MSTAPLINSGKIILSPDLAFDVDNLAARTALSKYSFVINRTGLYRLNTDVPAETPITSANGTLLSSDAIGGFMNYVGLKPTNPITVDNLFSEHTYISNVQNAQSFKIGQAFFIRALITVSSWPASTSTPLATIASEYRGTWDARGVMHSWETDTYTGKAVRINWSSNGNFLCYDGNDSNIPIDANTGRRFILELFVI